MKPSVRILKLALLTIVAALMLSTGSCLDATRFNTERKADLAQRARFEMDCDKLTFTPIQYGFGSQNPDIVTSYGVSGCGKKMVYVLTPYANQWVANTSSTKE